MRHERSIAPSDMPGRIVASRETVPLLPVAQTKHLRLPSFQDWTTMYDDIERLYLHERRKLRYVVAFVETKYGFRVT